MHSSALCTHSIKPRCTIKTAPHAGNSRLSASPSVITPELFAASICMQDHFFQPVLGQMVKLVFLSSGVHQIIFSIKSTLPFAVGQVQDVGLIFLSAMATSVVEASSKAGKDSDVTLGTVLVTLLLTTLLVGVLIILTGTPAIKAATTHDIVCTTQEIATLQRPHLHSALISVLCSLWTDLHSHQLFCKLRTQQHQELGEAEKAKHCMLLVESYLQV